MGQALARCSPGQPAVLTLHPDKPEHTNHVEDSEQVPGVLRLATWAGWLLEYPWVYTYGGLPWHGTG